MSGEPPAKKAKVDSKRVVLAYSGGLDTSCILKWLMEEGYEVVAFLADVGQPSEDMGKIKQKALDLGCKACYCVDLKKDFVTDYIFPSIRANTIYERRYLLGTSVARPTIAKAMVEVAHKENCKFVAHGATGKGNDQVRFELHANALDPTLTVIAPWRLPKFFERFEGRQHLLKYAAANGIHVEQTAEKSYSMDENLLHISYESGVLEDPSSPPPKGMWKMTRDIEDTPNKPTHLTIDFTNGDPVKVTNTDDNTVKTDPLELFSYLNEQAGIHGVGRVDVVENRFVGMKSRGCYETPGGFVLFTAHTDLETLVMDREVMRIRDDLAVKFADVVYNGFWFSPEGEFLRSCLDNTQKVVNGTVRLRLFKGNVQILGRESPNSLYNEEIASMDVAGDYNPMDAAGFIRINGLRLRMHHALQAKLKKSSA